MNKSNKIMALIAITSLNANAGFFPFPDPTDAVKSFKEIALLTEQLHELERHAKKFEKQISGIKGLKDEFQRKLDESKKLMSGKNNYGTKYNIAGLDRWEKEVRSWDRLARSANNKTSDPINKVMHEYKKKYQTLKGSEVLSRSSGKEQATVFDDMTESAITGDAIATQTYNDVDKDIDQLEKLKSEIDKSDSQKKTMDLIARIDVQKAIIQSKTNRIEATKVKMDAVNTQKEIADKKWLREALDWKNSK